MSLVFVECAAFCWVLACRNSTENMVDLPQRSVITRDVLCHVAREEVNTAAINPICHPHTINCPLLPPLNHDLHLPKAHHHILCNHLTAIDVLLARAALALVVHPGADDLHHNDEQMQWRRCTLLIRRLCLCHQNGHVNGGRWRINDCVALLLIHICLCYQCWCGNSWLWRGNGWCCCGNNCLALLLLHLCLCRTRVRQRLPGASDGEWCT